MPDTLKSAHVRHLDMALLRGTIARLLVEANDRIPEDVLEGCGRRLRANNLFSARRTLEHPVCNCEIAATEHRPACQDSGMTVVHLEVGQDVHWTEAVSETRSTKASGKARATDTSIQARPS